MMMKRTIQALLAIGALLLPVQALATITVIATDLSQNGSTVFDGSGLSTNPADTVVIGQQPLPAGLLGAEVNLNIVLDGPEAPGTVGSSFIGGATGTCGPIDCPDISFTSGGETLLTLDVNFIDVTNVTFGGSFPNFFITSLTLGGLDPDANQAELVVTGGTLAALFSQNGTASLLLENLSAQRGFGQQFSGAFSADATLTMEISPEPGTALMLGLGLAGLGWSGRRSRVR